MSQKTSFLPLAFPWLIPVISLQFLSHQMMYPAEELMFLSKIKVQSLSNTHPMACCSRGHFFEAS